MSKKLRFLENEKGLPVASDRILLARRTARSVFHSALQKGIAPRCFTEGTAEFLQQLRVTMYGAVPELRLCENHWKVDKLCGVIYSDWVRTRREQVVPAQNTKKRKRTSKDDANDHRRRPKHRQSPAPPPLDLDTLIPLSSHDHGFPKSLSPERTVPSPLDLDLPLFPDSPTDTRQPPDEAPADPLPPTPNGSPVLPQSLQFDIQNPLADLFGAGDDGPETPAPPTPSGLPTSSKPATASSTPATPSLLPPAPAPQATQPTQPKGRASGNSTKHVPGAANTAWNLFGRMYMAQPANKNKTTAEVKQVWDKEMNVEARKPYMDQAQTYKDAEKARKEAEKAAGNAPTKGKGKAKAKGKGTDILLPSPRSSATPSQPFPPRDAAYRFESDVYESSASPTYLCAVCNLLSAIRCVMTCLAAIGGPILGQYLFVDLYSTQIHAQPPGCLRRRLLGLLLDVIAGATSSQMPRCSCWRHALHSDALTDEQHWRDDGAMAVKCDGGRLVDLVRVHDCLLDAAGVRWMLLDSVERFSADLRGLQQTDFPLGLNLHIFFNKYAVHFETIEKGAIPNA
ncbi:hypothetical protein C8F01DRAFT_1093530 [Mycena amicta]|nr:hypothetical protein C8F01DRAFT_1093530 [Mycena amicta]